MHIEDDRMRNQNIHDTYINLFNYTLHRRLMLD